MYKERLLPVIGMPIAMNKFNRVAGSTADPNPLASLQYVTDIISVHTSLISMTVCGVPIRPIGLLYDVSWLEGRSGSSANYNPRSIACVTTRLRLPLPSCPRKRSKRLRSASQRTKLCLDLGEADSEKSTKSSSASRKRVCSIQVSTKRACEYQLV